MSFWLIEPERNLAWKDPTDGLYVFWRAVLRLMLAGWRIEGACRRCTLSCTHFRASGRRLRSKMSGAVKMAATELDVHGVGVVLVVAMLGMDACLMSAGVELALRTEDDTVSLLRHTLLHSRRSYSLRSEIRRETQNHTHARNAATRPTQAPARSEEQALSFLTAPPLTNAPLAHCTKGEKLHPAHKRASAQASHRLLAWRFPLQRRIASSAQLYHSQQPLRAVHHAPPPRSLRVPARAPVAGPSFNWRLCATSRTGSSCGQSSRGTQGNRTRKQGA